MTPGSTQSVTEMSTRDISGWGQGGRSVGLTTLPSSYADCLEILGSQNSWGPKGLSWPVMGQLYLLLMLTYRWLKFTGTLLITTCVGVQLYCVQAATIEVFIVIRSNEIQQYAGVYLLQNYSTCFGRVSYPSSGVHQTVTAASATGHITCKSNNLPPA